MGTQGGLENAALRHDIDETMSAIGSIDTGGDLAVFAAVVASGGFAAAARALALTPSAVSKRVSRLEDRLGVRLFQRTTRQVNLTEAGERFHERSLRILAEIEEAEQEAAAVRGTPRRLLRINASVAFAKRQLAPLMPAFLARYPEVQVELAGADRYVDLVASGVDVAVRFGGQTDSSLIARKLAPLQRMLCAAPVYVEKHGLPRTPADLVRHNCLILNQQSALLDDWLLVGPLGPLKQRVKGNFVAGNGEVLFEALLAGLGIARVTDFMAAEELRAGRLVRVLPDYTIDPHSAIYAVYAPGRHVPPKVRAFIDFLVKQYSPRPPWQR